MITALRRIHGPMPAVTRMRESFDPAKHPRVPGGHHGGGEFVSLGGIAHALTSGSKEFSHEQAKAHASALLGLSSRTAAEQYLSHHKFTVPQLRSISAQMGVKHPSKASKAQIAGGILDQIAPAAGGHGDLVSVWDVEAGKHRMVSRAEAAAGLVRYGRSLGPGSPAAGVAERQAMELLRGGPASPSADLESRIRAAYDAAPKGRTGFATLEDVRKQLGDVPPGELDRALAQFGNHEHVILAPESNQKSLTAAQRAAAVHIGGQPKHLLKIETPGKASATFGERLSQARQGPRVANMPPVQIHVDASSGSDTGRWRATEVHGMEGTQAGLLAAVTRRVRGSSEVANERLRGAPGAPSGSLAERDIKALDGAMRQSRLSTDAVVWRGANPKRIGIPSGDATGHEWSDRGFVGTTGSRSVAENSFAEKGILLRILAPAGTSAIAIQGGGEHEVLLDRGLRFRVVADHRIPGRVRQLDVEVVGQDRAALSHAATAAPKPGAARARMAAEKPAPPSVSHLESLPSRAAAEDALQGLSKAQLASLANEMLVPRASSLTVADLRRAVVDAAVGRRLDSEAIRGFSGPLHAPTPILSAIHLPPLPKPGAARARMAAERPSTVKLSTAEHVAALEKMATREDAAKHLAGIKGVDLTALAKHYSIGGTVAEKRHGIVETTVGTRLNSRAIRTGSWDNSGNPLAQAPPKPSAGAARAKMAKAAAPSTHELVSALQAAQSEQAGQEILARLGRTKAGHQALATALGVEHRPSDTVAALKDAILRQAVTRRLEHAAYLRRRNLTD